MAPTKAPETALFRYQVMLTLTGAVKMTGHILAFPYLFFSALDTRLSRAAHERCLLAQSHYLAQLCYGPLISPAPESPESANDFSHLCPRLLPHVSYHDEVGFPFQDFAAVQWWWCTDYSPANSAWMNTSPASDVTTILWVKISDNLSGYIKCYATYATSTAPSSYSPDGPMGGFVNFAQVSLHDSAAENMQTGATIIHPLYAALSALSDMARIAGGDPHDSAAYRLMTVLGFPARYNSSDSTIEFGSPSLITIGRQLVTGTVHMSAAVALPSIEPNATVQTTELIWVLTLKMPVIPVAGILLAAWFILLAICTVQMHGRTFGGSLGVYVAARQLAHEPSLLRDSHPETCRRTDS